MHGELKFPELELRERFDGSPIADYRRRLDKLEEMPNTRPVVF